MRKGPTQHAAASAPATSASEGEPEAASRPPAARSPEEAIAAADAAFEDGDLPRAVAVLSGLLARPGLAPRQRADALWRLSEIYEALRDCRAVVRTLGRFLDAASDDVRRIQAWMRKGACEAEIGDFAASREAYARAREEGGERLGPAARIETYAREGYAAFEMGDLERAEKVLAEGDAYAAEILESTRLDDYYFVGMIRFYRGAIWHVRFRQVTIRSRRRDMARDFNTKMEYLAKAQAFYREAVRAKHMFWVSAAGYQMGQLFAEFYDAIMYAPVPNWLSARQREIYYEELRKQLRPALEKAIWVFEKTVETARRLGYTSPFVERAEAKLAHLRAVVVAGQGRLGEPDPHLVPEIARPIAPAEPGGEDRGPLERALHVPRPTPL